MRIAIFSVFCTTAVAFAPGAMKSTYSRSSLSMSTTTMRVGNKSIPNPLKALPWNAKKEQERTARKLKLESSSLHRELGIADDATFEDIMEVTQKLIQGAEAEGDVKKKIKVEVAKDRIMQIRLNERLAGLATLTEDAKAQSRLEEQDEDDEDFTPETKAKKEWSTPGWTKGLIVKPDQTWRNKQIKVFGIMTLTSWLLPPLAEKCIMLNWMAAAGQVGRRGMGENPDSDFNPYEGKRNKPHQRTAIILSLVVWLGLKIWTGLLGDVKMVFGPRYAVVIEATLMNIGLGIFTAYTQTYKPK